MSGFQPPRQPGRGAGFPQPSKSFSVRPVGTRPGGPDGLSVNPGADLARTRSLPQPPLGRWEGVNDPLGIGGLGRSDLDPLGRSGTGMTADPRGMRHPPPMGLPPGHPPGARFDPYGPVPPQPPTFGGRPIDPYQPQPQPQPFAEPNPDHLQPLPFPGQEPPVPGQPRRGPPTFGGPSPNNEQPPPGFDDMFM